MDTLQKLMFLHRVKSASGGGVSWETISGTLPLTLLDAAAKPIKSLIRYGKIAQDGTPTPSSPVDLVCNNGVVKLGASGTNLLDMAEENIRLRYYINDSGVESSNNQNFYNTKFIPVKPNTAYTLSASEHVYYLSIMEYDSNKGFLKRTLDGSASEKHVSTTFTTRSDTAYILIGSNPNRTALSIDDVTSVDWMLNEGPAALPYEPYTEGIYTDGAPEALSVGGTNIFYNDTAWNEGFFITSGKVAAAGANCTFVMRCSPNTTYYWKHCSLVGGMRAFTVDADAVEVGVDGKWILQNPVLGEINKVYSATTGANAKWLCVCFGRNDSNAAPIADQWSDFMLSVIPITVDTPYEPYREPQTASVANLYAVGDYRDEQDIISGAVTRRVGVKALDGTETAQYASSGILLLTIDDILASGRGLDRVLCTHYREGTSGDYYCNHNYANRYMYFHDVNLTSLEDWRAYLAEQYAQGTPVIVIYPLATEVTESASLQGLSTVIGTNVVSTVANVAGLDGSCEYAFKSSGSIVGTATVGTAVVG